jgi:hypothetical protein
MPVLRIDAGLGTGRADPRKPRTARTQAGVEEDDFVIFAVIVWG